MLYPLVEKQVAVCGDKILLQIKRQNQYVYYSYRQAHQKALALAAHLRQIGVSPSEHVALWGDSIPEWCIAYLGIHYAGAIVVPLDIQYQENIVAHLLQFAGVKVIICGEALLTKAQSLERELHHLTLEPGSPHCILDLPDAGADFQALQRQPDDTASLIFTSGTTGDPKGVMLSSNNFVSDAKALLARNWLGANENILCVLPLHHCYAFTSCFMIPLLNGNTTTFQPILKGPEIIAVMQETKVTIMGAVPKLLEMFHQGIFSKITRLPGGKRTLFWLMYFLAKWTRKLFGFNLGRVLFKKIHQQFGFGFRFFVSGGAKLDRQIGEKLWVLGFNVAEGYGLTETAPILACSPPYRFSPGSVGPALPGVEMRIDAPNKDGIGEVLVRGPILMKGYYQNEKATAEVIRDGWFYTGDLGYLNRKGYLYITGRAKEVIVLDSGKNIYPEEVEKHYSQSPLIAELCAFGKEEADGRIESLAALVVPDFEEVKRRAINNIEREIKFDIENLGMQVPSYMRLLSFRIVGEALPRTRLGKLKRNLIARTHFENYQEEERPPQELSDEEQQLLSKPDAPRMLRRLQELAGYDKEILPGDSLELDLGLDSLKNMELLVILEQEFGAKVPEGTGFTHVHDLLALLKSDSSTAAEQKFSWRRTLAQRPDPPLEQLFRLQRGPIKRWVIDSIRWLLRILFWLCFRASTQGYEKILAHDAPCLITPNHQSYLDPLLIYFTMPSKILHNTVFIAFDAYFSRWPLSWLVGMARIIKTATSHTNIASLQYAATALDQGYSVCIFPEGQRSVDGSLNKTMQGAGILSCEKQVPMFPVAINGAIGALSRPNPGFHFVKIDLEVLPPIFPEKTPGLWPGRLSTDDHFMD